MTKCPRCSYELTDIIEHGRYFCGCCQYAESYEFQKIRLGIAHEQCPVESQEPVIDKVAALYAEIEDLKFRLAEMTNDRDYYKDHAVFE